MSQKFVRHDLKHVYSNACQEKGRERRGGGRGGQTDRQTDRQTDSQIDGDLFKISVCTSIDIYSNEEQSCPPVQSSSDGA